MKIMVNFVASLSLSAFIFFSNTALAATWGSVESGCVVFHHGPAGTREVSVSIRYHKETDAFSMSIESGLSNFEYNEGLQVRHRWVLRFISGSSSANVEFNAQNTRIIQLATDERELQIDSGNAAFNQNKYLLPFLDLWKIMKNIQITERLEVYVDGDLTGDLHLDGTSQLIQELFWCAESDGLSLPK
ncbi:MAG: hypothetical protein AAF198_00200 [Pseudomonadota bacterium]